MFLEKVKDLAYRLYSRYFCRARLLRGRLAKSEADFRCLFLGSSKLLSRIEERMFSAPPHLERSWRMRVSALSGNGLERAGRVDMCVAHLPARHLERVGPLSAFRTQELVDQTVDVSPGSPSALKFQQKLKDRERRARRHGWTYRITDSAADFELFYDHMYLVHARKQHGKYAFAIPREKLRRVFDEGHLLFLMEGELAIAGLLFSHQDGTLRFEWLGVLDGERSYVEKGAISALYCFSVEYGRTAFSFDRCHFGDALSFLDDGVFLFKRILGASVSPYGKKAGWLFFINPRQSPLFGAFFEANPMIVHSGPGLMALVGVPDSHDPTVEEIKRLKSQYHSPGLTGIILIEPTGRVSRTLTFNAPARSLADPVRQAQ